MASNDSPELLDVLHRSIIMIFLWEDVYDGPEKSKLRQALTYAERAVKAVQKSDPRMASIRNHLCNALLREYAKTGDSAHLEKDIERARWSSKAQRTSQDPTTLQILAIFLFKRYQRTNNNENLEEAFEKAQNAILNTSADDSCCLSQRQALLAEIMFAK